MRKNVRSAEELVGLLEMVRADFAVVGSAACSVYGEARSSSDVDLLVMMNEAQLERLAMMAGTEFYFDLGAAKAAWRSSKPFYLLSMMDVTKFHFYPANADAFGMVQLERKRLERVDFLADVRVPVASPEDVVLAKLRWFDKGKRAVARHWADVQALVKARGEDLDWKHVEAWGPRLGVGDLVERLRAV